MKEGVKRIPRYSVSFDFNFASNTLENERIAVFRVFHYRKISYSYHHEVHTQ